MHKAETAANSSKTLLDLGDTDSAASRAYYAMFDAARAMLKWANVVPARGKFKTHNGVLTAFYQYLVKPGLFPAELGTAIQRAQAVRLIADYEASEVPEDDAVATVKAAQKFVAAAAELIAKPYEDLPLASDHPKEN